ncbi:anti-sigma factor [Streptomyces sp. JJ66]|uniref:anti-sigma factor n=1 Tax=Streptomyces sp. JJ66 TaxID=2803843 RepID=UPI001C59F712|nr:anti-sigma factor [Streptomyces sp. JJ66]MBW1600531.1 anti-sigma factor [Streptomyces sp. JJ66]
MTTVDLHTLTGAYAVHALSDTERAEFERHLAVCGACAQEVRELTATAERLGLAVSATLPPQLRARVLARVTTVRQEPPRVPRQGGGSWLSRRTRALPRMVLAASVAAAAAFGGLAVWQYQAAEDARQQAEQADQRSDALTRVLTAGDALVTSGELPGGGTGTIVVSHDQGRAAFLAAGLPRPPSGQVYQLWFAKGEEMRPAGLLDPHATTTATLMEGQVRDATAMGITLEPSGGSPKPTSDPMAVMDLPA